MKVLLVFEGNPDTLDFYVIEDPTEEQMRILHAANGHFINSNNENEECMLVNQMICENPWADCRIELPYIGQVDAVFTCGFMI